MKIEKKHWIMLIVGLAVLFAVYYFFFKKKPESSYNYALPIIGDSAYAASDINSGVIMS
jgi:lipoprotein signal peptidase